MSDLLDSLPSETLEPLLLAPGAWLLPSFARLQADDLLDDLLAVADAAPFRHLLTPGGATMSVAMTNCGRLGWVSDARGYRYEGLDPLTGAAWPVLPARLLDVARRAAASVGYERFSPDACLVNRYVPGSKLSLHQDRDELDLAAPIVSISLGLPAVFLFGGPARGDRPRRIRLASGDVVIWGGASRLVYHGIAPLMDGHHRLTGRVRYNLTFRTVGL
ncbi:DNA oxidative demethylase AlkB [Lichenicola sp.]|uniref:DNA oxidative demethylase AlkB n=1 Tax=Lichenicola sp. TaxID=2804529 RepID=UPI003B008FD9